MAGKGTIPQSYPRIDDPKKAAYGCLDESYLVPHSAKIPQEQMKELISAAILNASRKSSRQILAIPAEATQAQLEKIYEREGTKLLAYFKKYCGDPAATAHQVHKKHYRQVGVEQFRNRTLQKERMNSGWRYQFLAVDCAHHSKRFKSVSDIGTAEADFNAIVEFSDKSKPALSLYVSIKNRSNTMGGQDWPKAIQALEIVAKEDKNRVGPYCCIFGIAMEKGLRRIPQQKKSQKAYSDNTEIWLSDFFWPFFANYSYEEIMNLVLDVLVAKSETVDLISQVEIPDKLLEEFGAACRKAGLLDENGNFDDPYKLVKFFCS